MVKKIVEIFIVVIFAFAFFFSQQSFAASKSGGVGTTTGTEAIDSQIKSQLKYLNAPSMIGLTCGVPNSISDQCCTGKVNTTPIGTQLDYMFPDFFCLPSILTTPVKLILTPITQTVTAVGAIGQIITGHPIGGLKTIGIGAINTVKSGICLISFGHFACNEGDKKPLCVSQIPKAFAGMFIAQTPVGNLTDFQGLKNAQVCIEGARQTSSDSASQSCKCVQDPLGKGALCEKYISQPTELQACLNCSSNGIWTGIGCINTSVGGFVGSLMGIGISLAGISALLCIIYSAIILQVSQGNPERIKKAREYLTNCIIGLLIILLSVFILRLLGVTVLKIPGFI